MSTTNDYAARREEMARLSREEVANLDAQIEQAEAHVRELRAERQEAVRILHVVDPNSRPPSQKSGPRPGRTRANISAEGADEFVKFLRKQYPDEGFTITDLQRHKDWGWSKSRTHYGIHYLLDQGVLRLDRVRGNHKFYRLTAAGGQTE